MERLRDAARREVPGGLRCAQRAACLHRRGTRDTIERQRRIARPCRSKPACAGRTALPRHRDDEPGERKRGRGANQAQQNGIAERGARKAHDEREVQQDDRNVEPRVVVPDARSAMLKLSYTLNLSGVGGADFSYLIATAPVPELQTWALLLSGIGVLGAVAWRRRRDDTSV